MNDLILQSDPLRNLEILNKTATDHYRYQVNSWINWLRENTLTVTEESLRAYFLWLNTESGYKARSIAVKRQAVKKRVRQLFKDAPIDQRMKIDQVLKELDHETETKPPKVNTEEVTADRVLDSGEYRDLLVSCRTDRQKMFIKFLWATGCRVSEMVNILIRDCDQVDRIVKITVMGKGRKERTVRIERTLFDEIQNTFKGSVFLFETGAGHAYNRSYVTRQIAKIGQRIGKHISAHSLRHSFATRKVNQLPGKIDAISRYLGHSSVSITLDMYCHNQMTDGELLDLAV